MVNCYEMHETVHSFVLFLGQLILDYPFIYLIIYSFNLYAYF